jgi:two-component system sensor histidine kinase/response regulator
MLFQSFQQADNSITRQFGGSGLGLAISKQLVGLMNGNIGVNSVYGEGSTFWFSVRFLKGEHAPNAHITEPPSVEQLVTLKGYRILLVEDNLLNQEIVLDILTDMGLSVSLCQNGQEAIDFLQHQNVDLILMDMQMPIMDGLSATRILRSLPKFQSIPILAMTANAMPSEREACFTAGMNDHITKPINPDLLFQHLLHWLHPSTDKSLPLLKQSIPSQTSLLHINGLDVTSALHRLRGKEDLYITLLHQFTDTQKDSPQQIMAALDANDWPLAERLAHTLKGSASNIGLNGVQDFALALEDAIRMRDDRASIDFLAQHCNQVLMRFISEFSQRFTVHPKEANATEINLDIFKSIYQDLLHALSMDDVNANALWSDHKETLKHILKDDFKSINDEIQNFDFPTAYQRLKNLTINF